MKEKYKAIIQRIEESKKGERVLETLNRYTHATNVSEAQRNIIYHLQNDDRIYIGIDKNNSTTDKIVRWEITQLDLERNIEEVKTGRGKDKKPRKRRTKEEMNNVKVTLTMDKKIYELMKIYIAVRNIPEKEFIGEAIRMYVEEGIDALDDTLRMLKGV